MVYRKRSYRRKSYRRSRGKKSWMDKKYSAMEVASAAWKGVKYIKGLVNVEFKKFDLNNSVNPTTSGGIVPLNLMAQGDTDQTRNGNSILQKSIYLNFTIDLGGTAANTLVRSMLVFDKQQIADTAPGVADILDSSGANNMLAPLNNETVGRFKVLEDKIFQVDSIKNGIIRRFTSYHKLYGHARYNGATASDIQKGGLYWLLVSNQATNSPTVTYSTRLTFVDN